MEAQISLVHTLSRFSYKLIRMPEYIVLLDTKAIRAAVQKPGRSNIVKHGHIVHDMTRTDINYNNVKLA